MSTLLGSLGSLGSAVFASLGCRGLPIWDGLEQIALDGSVLVLEGLKLTAEIGGVAVLRSSLGSGRGWSLGSEPAQYLTGFFGFEFSERTTGVGQGEGDALNMRSAGVCNFSVM